MLPSWQGNVPSAICCSSCHSIFNRAEMGLVGCRDPFGGLYMPCATESIVIRLSPYTCCWWPYLPPTHIHTHSYRKTQIHNPGAQFPVAANNLLLLAFVAAAAAAVRQTKGKQFSCVHEKNQRKAHIRKHRQTTMPICVIRKRAAHQLKTISKCCRRAQVT